MAEQRGEAAPGERSKRRAYLVVLVVITGLMVVLTFDEGSDAVFERVAFPVVALYASVLAGLIWTRRLSPCWVRSS